VKIVCNSMKKHLLLSSWLTVATTATVFGAEIDKIERQFRELPIEARELTGPLFWLHGDESPERLATYVGKESRARGHVNSPSPVTPTPKLLFPSSELRSAVVRWSKKEVVIGTLLSVERPWPGAPLCCRHWPCRA
jgi:hypothetical protein